jgi:Fur family ferric uptake transcriptional regulator
VTDWTQHAQRELEREGYRLSGPRSAVVETLDDLGCSVTAKEIADSLHGRGQDIGLASVYRTLELLDKLRLTRRVDAAEGVARYEPVNPNGEHHHHIVCDSCGEVTAFEDSALERAIERLAGKVDYAIEGHDVTLRGECPACRARYSRQLTRPPDIPWTSAAASADRAPTYVSPALPFGPSESAYSLPPTLAPASRAIARSMSGLTELSGKTASTCSRRIWSTSFCTSPADACAWVESDGITAPTTSTP